MKKKETKKMEIDNWNEKSRKREEEQTKSEDNDWNKKEDEDKDRYNNEFHEETYDT